MTDLLDVMAYDLLGKPVWAWAIFFFIVLFLLVLDLGILNRGDEEIGVRRSLKLSVFYITIGLLFGWWIWREMGSQKGIEYLTGFVLEKTLAMDNIFVIAMIFGYFKIPRKYQHRVLFWGILGVILLRGIMIGAGAALVSRYDWVLYVFAAFLVYTGFKLLFAADEPEEFGENAILRFVRKHLRVTDKLHENRFFVRLSNPNTGQMTLFATPLFLALVSVEFADVLFAFDSVPAIFAVTTDPYIVYTSNIFAILGLRALYFALAALLERFVYLKYALSIVLIFIGAKVFLADMMGKEKFPPAISLSVTVAVLLGGIVLSLWKTRAPAAAQKGTGGKDGGGGGI